MNQPSHSESRHARQGGSTLEHQAIEPADRFGQARSSDWTGPVMVHFRPRSVISFAEETFSLLHLFTATRETLRPAYSTRQSRDRGLLYFSRRISSRMGRAVRVRSHDHGGRDRAALSTAVPGAGCPWRVCTCRYWIDLAAATPPNKDGSCIRGCAVAVCRLFVRFTLNQRFFRPALGAQGEAVALRRHMPPAHIGALCRRSTLTRLAGAASHELSIPLDHQPPRASKSQPSLAHRSLRAAVRVPGSTAEPWRSVAKAASAGGRLRRNSAWLTLRVGSCVTEAIGCGEEAQDYRTSL